MSVDGFELGSEGGLLENAAYATLRNYVMVSVFFMFVTTSFVANAVIRDDETGFGPIIRSTRITKFEYVLRPLPRRLRRRGAAACWSCRSAIVLGSVMPWADPRQLGPNRLADHLYGYFLVALPNLFIHSAIFFALATITRSMMATYLGVIGFVSGFFMLQGSFGDRPRLQTTAVAGRAVRVARAQGRHALLDGGRAERDAAAIQPAPCSTTDCSGSASPLSAWRWRASRYRFADQGMSKRERKKQKLAEHASADSVSPYARSDAPCTAARQRVPSCAAALDAHAVRGEAGRR